MKKLLTILLVLALAGCSSGWTTINVDNKESSRTHAVWVSFLEYQKILKGKSEAEFTASVKTMMDNLVSLGINRVYAHASAYGDAFYKSAYLPWSEYCTGTLGKDPGYDPFAIIVNEAELRQIKVDAWINPLRSFTPDQMAALPENCQVRQWFDDDAQRARKLMLADGRYYLNPGDPEVIALVAQVAGELLANYKISGIHIDDYFYPTAMSDDLDQATYDDYLARHPGAGRADYRLAATDALAKALHQEVAKYSGRLFSISPNPNFDTDLGTYYCDAAKWLTSKEYCDVMVPQIYFGFDNETQPFKDVVDRWEKAANGSVDLVFGLAAYKVGQPDQYAGTGADEWVENSDILSRQLEYAKAQRYYDGIALFRYWFLFYPEADIRDQMQLELSKLLKSLA